MKNKDKELISNILGVETIKINSNLVSYQNRSRYYWTNIPNVTEPQDKNIDFQDYICKEHEKCKEFKVNKTASRIKMWGNGIEGSCPNVTHANKINCITCRQDRWKNTYWIYKNANSKSSSRCNWRWMDCRCNSSYIKEY